MTYDLLPSTAAQQLLLKACPAVRTVTATAHPSRSVGRITVMTQLEQVGRRTTVFISAAVALVVSLTITISGMLIIPELTSAPTSGGVDRYAESGRAWQVQRELESSHFRSGLQSSPGYPAGGREAHWQRYKEQTNPNR